MNKNIRKRRKNKKIRDILKKSKDFKKYINELDKETLKNKNKRQLAIEFHNNKPKLLNNKQKRLLKRQEREGYLKPEELKYLESKQI